MMENNNNTNPPGSQMTQPTPIDDLDYSKTPNPQTPPPTPLKTPDVPTSSQLLPKTHNFPLHKILLIALIILAIIFITAYVGVYYLLNQQLDKLTHANKTPTAPISLTTPTPTPNPTANPDQIGANWKTYANSTYKYSFKYPPDWIINTESLQSTYLTTGEPPKITPKEPSEIPVYANSADPLTYASIDVSDAGGVTKTIEEVAKEYRDGPQQEIIIGGRKGVQVVQDRSNSEGSTLVGFNPTTNISAFVKKANNTTLMIQLETSNPDKFRPVFEEILKTFNFSDLQDTVACTQEAKQCSDGSYVSRTGPNCEFAACP